MEDLNMNNTFFFINKTALFFPKMTYSSESIPLGDSIPVCISVSWGPIESKLIYEFI
jgi:hypothetical protein